MLRNILKDFKKRWILNLCLGLFLAVVIFGGGFVFFHYVVFWMLFQDQYQPFGALLATRLLSLSFMVFFFMLLFSNIISILATVYFSREVPFLMSLPVSHSSVFWAKFVESLVYSSWALIMMSFPLLISFALRKNDLMLHEAARALNLPVNQTAGLTGVPIWFFVAAPLVFMVFAAIPALLAAGLTVGFASWLPARRARMLLVGLVLLMGSTSYPMISRLISTIEMIDSPIPESEDFQKMLGNLRTSMPRVMPYRWLSDAINAMSGGTDVGQSFWGGLAASSTVKVPMDEKLFWNGLLLSTAAMLFVCVSWLVPRLYFKGWALSGHGGRSARSRSWSVLDILRYPLAPLRQSVRGLVIKDFKTFFRDPSQWLQLVILFGLLFIYVANLRNMPEGISSPFWQNILSFFNLAATCFVASTMATRFAYPMLSLEGRQCWVIGLAPIKATTLVWQKFWLCWVGCAGAVVTIMVISAQTIRLSPLLQAICYSTAILITLGLSSIAIGIGALMPDFREDNPATIANNLGGTTVIVASMVYVGLTTFLEAFLVDAYVVKGVLLPIQFCSYLALLGAANVAVIVTPMALALRKWRVIEFL